MEQALVLLWSHDALVGRRCRAEPPAADLERKGTSSRTGARQGTCGLEK